LKLNRESEAREILERLLATVRETRPDDRGRISQLLNDIGCCYESKGERVKADRFFREAIDICETRGYLPFLNLAVQLHKDKSDVEARAILQRAIQLFPNEWKLAFTLAGIEEQNNNQTAALHLGEHAIRLRGAPPEAFAYVGWLLSDWFGDFRKAEAILEAARKQFPKDKLVGNNLAYVHLMLGEVDRAAEVLSKFQAEDRDVFLIATNGLLALKKGNEDKAREMYLRASKIATGIGNSALSRGVLQKMHLEFARHFLENGQVEQATEELQNGIAIKNGRAAYERDLKTLQNSLA
jgi:Flp pilus assembly protein TadD